MTPLIPDWAWLVATGCLLLGAAFAVIASRMRRARGLSAGRTLALDDVSLYSARYGLAGRPDRILRAGNVVIPEEWKSARRLWPSHIAQMGAYFLLIEERYGVRPPHGFVVLGTGKRHRIENDARLRAWVLGLADRIREARRTSTCLSLSIPSPPSAALAGRGSGASSLSDEYHGAHANHERRR